MGCAGRIRALRHHLARRAVTVPPGARRGVHAGLFHHQPGVDGRVLSSRSGASRRSRSADHHRDGRGRAASAVGHGGGATGGAGARRGAPLPLPARRAPDGGSRPGTSRRSASPDRAGGRRLRRRIRGRAAGCGDVRTRRRTGLARLPGLRRTGVAALALGLLVTGASALVHAPLRTIRFGSATSRVAAYAGFGRSTTTSPTPMATRWRLREGSPARSTWWCGPRT